MEEAAINLWSKIREEALASSANEPILASFFYSTILNHKDLSSALSYQLANRLDCSTMPAILVREVINYAFLSDPKWLTPASAMIKQLPFEYSSQTLIFPPDILVLFWH